MKACEWKLALNQTHGETSYPVYFLAGFDLQVLLIGTHSLDIQRKAQGYRANRTKVKIFC